MINKQFLIGRVGQNPEIIITPNNKKIAKFTVATSESYKDENGDWQEDTTWHNIRAFANIAERIEKSVEKGDLVYIEGKSKNEKYNDKDGNTRTSHYVIVSVIRTLSAKSQSDSQSDSQSSNQNNGVNNGVNDGVNDTGDDLPF